MKSILPNNFGEKTLAENCWSISVNLLLKRFNKVVKEEFLKNQFKLAGVDLELVTSKTNFGGTRYWFKCPICNKRKGKIYRNPISRVIGCRNCLNLDYRKRRFKGMVEEGLYEPNKI